MPFTSEQVRERFCEARSRARLAHAYLLSGADRLQLETLGGQLAAMILGEATAQHPDFHVVRPESKSRRIRIEQMRDLEKNLRLKAYRAPYKVALICEGERMCLGGADAANAFLKTLEEPPEKTLILLTSTEPQIILPTILSRCVRITVQASSPAAEIPASDRELIEKWFQFSVPGALRGYARAALLQHTWQQWRERIEDEVSPEKKSNENEDEDVAKAAVEGEVLLARKRTIAVLQGAYWQKERQALERGSAADHRSRRAVVILDELNLSLLQNVEPALAAERACLALEGVLTPGL